MAQKRETHSAKRKTSSIIIFTIPNVPLFLAKNLIQHFGVFNPSPRDVESVGTAFKNGKYTWTDGTSSVEYRSGVWGGMDATIAAIILDRESTLSVLDYDPSYGLMRETPISTLFGMMRSLDYTGTYIAKNIFPIFWTDMTSRIGQFPYKV